MSFSIWALVVGALLITMALAGSLMKRLPLSASMFYMAAGYLLGTGGLGLMTADPHLVSGILERVAEVAVLISLFSVGLKLGLPFSSHHWRLPLRLAFVSMTLVVGLIALVGFFLLGLHELGTWGWRWLAIDVVWSLVGGLFIGALLGTMIGRLVVYLRTRHQEAVGLDEFLALGLVALAFGVAQLASTYGFLAVFAAGLALQRVKERSRSQTVPDKETADLLDKDAHLAQAIDPDLASAYMMQAVRGFNEQLERIAELVIVLAVGAMLAYIDVDLETMIFLVLLFCVLRPLSVWLGLLGAPVSGDQRLLIAWFGIRGIGSIYYLMFALNHGLSGPLANQAINLTLSAVAASIIVHGISVTPLMSLYARRQSGKSRRSD